MFWFILIKKSAFYFESVWNNSRELTKVVVSDNQIRSYGPYGKINSQKDLVIDLSIIAQITWSVTAPGSIGYIKLLTRDSEQYYFTPANPFDPTLRMLATNTDEIIAFINIVNSFMSHQTTDYDENPYIRQLSTTARPVYLEYKNDIHWDKNVSPWKYYNELVPASEEKKRKLEGKIYKIFVLGGLIIAVLGFLYALLLNFRW